MSKKTAPLFILVFILLFTSDLVSSGEILRQVNRKIPIEETNSQPAPGFKSDVSQRNLLGLERPAPFSLPTGKRGRPLSDAIQMDTVRVLVLKVEFQPENPDNPRTTGNGTFDLRTYDQFFADEGHYIDPAPHNTSYFNSHLEALRRYWYFVSDKKLQIDWDIYPLAESASFRLPVEMAYYGSRGPWADSSIGDQLGNFLIDAISFADSAAPQIDFSAYQSVLIFHAGSDRQNNIDFINDTPDDFYTGFVRLAEPIFVDNGATAVNEGILMPETVSQDNRVNALNGVMAHEFGHQLGLVDLYNTETFMTQVGDFSLMDNNGMSVGVQFEDNMAVAGGTMAVYPDAWSRAYLGFNIPRIVTRGQNDSISAAVLDYPDDEIIKVPITDFEYFLVENRQQVNPNTALIADPQTHVILGPGFQDPQGLIIASGEYDLFIPGHGMLIWHIDEYVAYLNYIPWSTDNNFFNNSLQWDKDRRFVSVVEADGIIDLGGNYYRGYGSDADFFKVGNNTALTPFTRPSSQTNLAADSHIYITGISASDTIMNADFDNDWLLPGWPQMSRPAGMTNPVIANIDRDTTGEILMAGGNQLLAWHFDGSKYIPNNDMIGVLNFDSSIAIYPLAVAADCDTTIVGRPVPVDLDGDGDQEVAVATLSGWLYAFNMADTNSDGRAEGVLGFPKFLGNGPIIPPIAVDFLPQAGMEMIAFDSTGKVELLKNPIVPSPESTLIYNAGGTILSASAYSTSERDIIDMAVDDAGSTAIIRISSLHNAGIFSTDFSDVFEANRPCRLASGDIDRDGAVEIVAVFSNSLKLIKSDGSMKWSRNIDNSLGSPALGDLNSDGYPEIVLAGDSKIYAFSYNGVLLDNFPINLALYDLNGVIAAEPVLGDVDNDRNPDIVVGLPSGSVYAFNWHGDRVAGFPLPSSYGISRACAIGDLNGDGKTDLLTVESSGSIKAWSTSIPANPMNIPWNAAGGDSKNSGYLAPSFEKPIFIADAQLPANSVYNYPNPAKNSTAIRFYLNNDSNVRIDIYDSMGERIYDARVNGQAHVNNEHLWNCNDIASGVYFCRVEADSGAEKVWRIIKIAIVK